MRTLSFALSILFLVGCGAEDAAPEAEAPAPAPEAVDAMPDDPGMAPGSDDPPLVADPAEPEPVYDEMAYRIVGAVAGDRACYLDLEPESGGSVETYEADFEVCYQIEDDGLTGRLVTYEMETASIMAASCEGDIDCRDTDEVDLVTAIDLVD